MTLAEEGTKLRIQLVRMGSAHGRRYTPGLRKLILAWVDRAKLDGMRESECARLLGIPTRRFAQWRALAEQTNWRKMLVPVEITKEATPSARLVFIAPSGYRLDGVTIEQAITLMRALS
jgi:hypothetical protein